MWKLASQHRLAVTAGSAGSSVVACWLITDAESSKTALEAPKEDTKKLKDLPTRDEQVQRLKAGQQFDVLVVGGGATGCGAALDAQLRGLSTALIERGDFGSETSSRSTKLIWAGIRYIATATSQLLRWKNLQRPVEAIKDFSSEFRMVLNCHKERRLLVENNPHLISWVPIAVPIKSWVAWPPPFGHPIFATAPVTLPAVFKFYDSLSGFSCPPSHIMRQNRARRKFPQLDDDSKYVAVFYEAIHNDARTATSIALTAAQEGAVVTNHCEMVELLRDDAGKATGVLCKDRISGQTFPVYAKAIVFCGGPFTDELRRLEDAEAEPAVAGAAGTHIILPGYYSPAGIGLLDINTSDGRFLFFLPWQGYTLVGTTDRKDKVVSSPEPPEEEIQWLLKEVETYLSPDLKVRRADVLSAWQGFRPLARDPNAPPDAPISRDHVISTHPVTGVTFITGGKWTTYREMAEDVIDRVVEQQKFETAGPCRTGELPLRGGEGYTKNVPIMLVQEFGVSEGTAKHLAGTYGMHAFEVCRGAEPTGKRWPRFGNVLLEGFPYLECEVDYACRKEMVCTLTDMLSLRFRLAFLNRDAALAVAPKVADLMQKSLGWTRREKKQQLEEAQKYLASFGGPIPNQQGASVVTVVDVRELFQKFDHTNNNYIDFQDFCDAADMMGIPFENDKKARQAFKKLDRDNNGRVYEEEFVEWWQKQSHNDAFRRKLSSKVRFSGDEPPEESRGVMFG